MAGVNCDGLALDAVEDGDGAAMDNREGAGAFLGGVPDGAADGSGAVAALGAEVAVVVAGVEGLKDARLPLAASR